MHGVEDEDLEATGRRIVRPQIPVSWNSNLRKNGTSFSAVCMMQ